MRDARPGHGGPTCGSGGPENCQVFRTFFIPGCAQPAPATPAPQCGAPTYWHAPSIATHDGICRLLPPNPGRTQAEVLQPIPYKRQKSAKINQTSPKHVSAVIFPTKNAPENPRLPGSDPGADMHFLMLTAENPASTPVTDNGFFAGVYHVDKSSGSCMPASLGIRWARPRVRSPHPRVIFSAFPQA